MLFAYVVRGLTIIHRDLFPKTCFELRLPSVIRREAHPSYEQAEARSNKRTSDDEMACFATALAQQDQPLIVLAPGKTNGVDKLLAWLVDDRKHSHAWQHANLRRRMGYSRAYSIALWMVHNSAYMRTGRDLPRSWSCIPSHFNTVMARMANGDLWG